MEFIDTGDDDVSFEEFIEIFLESEDPKFTVFAPLNSAWDISPSVADQIQDDIDNDIDIASDVVLNLILTKELYLLQSNAADLCGRAYVMANGEYTYTECVGSDFFQIGEGNLDPDGYPKVIGLVKNILCSNGLIHVVDHVPLPPSLIETRAPSSAPTASLAPSSSPSMMPSGSPFDAS